MDTPLAGERIAEEKAYTKRYIDSLANRNIEYPTDYAPPLASRPRKIPAVDAPVSAPPDMDVEEATPQDAAVALTVKSLKPALTINVSAHLSDSVADLKALVAAQAGAPPADAQRLLLKGKALADAKLLKEYDLADGAVVHLMIKPGAIASPPAPAPAPAAPVAVDAAAAAADVAPPPSSLSATPVSRHGHQRTPSLTITTPQEGASPTEVPSEYAFTSNSELASPVSSRAFHETASNPEFWTKVFQLCESEFAHEDDARTVFDTFLVAMKGRLSASESAKIRDVVGVAGMGGGT